MDEPKLKRGEYYWLRHKDSKLSTIAFYGMDSRWFYRYRYCADAWNRTSYIRRHFDIKPCPNPWEVKDA